MIFYYAAAPLSAAENIAACGYGAKALCRALYFLACEIFGYAFVVERQVLAFPHLVPECGEELVRGHETTLFHTAEEHAVDKARQVEIERG